MAYYNEPFKRRPKPWVGLVGSASKPTITRVLTSDGPLYSPIYETGQGLELRVPKYQPTTSRGRYSSTPQYDYTMDASAGSATKKKGLSLNNMINAMSKMKAPTGMDFGRAGGRVGGSRPTALSPRALGVDALEMASADDPRKKWWKQWQGLMGA